MAKFKFKPVTKYYILTALKGLKDIKSPYKGPNKVPPKLLKDAAIGVVKVI